MYYTLTNFYQNHRRYIASRSDAMNRGDFGSQPPPLDGAPDPSSKTCFGFDTYSANGKTIQFYPCGLAAMSLFNDTFRLFHDPSGLEVNWTADRVSWPVSDARRFQSKPEAWLRANCYRLGGRGDPAADDPAFAGFAPSLRGFAGTGDENRSRYHCWHSPDSPELRAWMRPAPARRFWKLHRVFDGPLPAGACKTRATQTSDTSRSMDAARPD
jgi:hypothetical protein